jgi:hypothetical protein
MALTDKLTAIGNAIREKNGTTELIPLVDMPQAILDIVSGGGAEYESIVYNEDNTITLTDKKGIIHTMECAYENDKLIGVTYDGKAIDLIYDGDVLVSIGKTVVDMANVPSGSADSKGLVFFNMGEGIISGEPCNENPFKKSKFYNVTIDGTVYKAGSDGSAICTDVRDDIHLYIVYEEELGTLAYMYVPQGEEDFSGVHTIGISERQEEEIGWNITINDYGYWYFYSNDFELGEVVDVQVIDEDGVEYWNSEGRNKIFAENVFCFGFKGQVHATDMSSTLEKAIASGKKITFILTQTIDGVTTTKTYGGTTYDFYYENPFGEDIGGWHYMYGFGNDYISVADARSA